MIRIQSVIALVALVAATSASAAVTQYSGDITSGAQYDLYPLQLEAGDIVVATLVCDESPPPPGNRPLDPVLSVFFPGSDPTDVSNADIYNDDGFGSDDDPVNGVDCNAFDSARVHFMAPAAGTYTFRADGFGSATGPYTLRILVTPAVGAPALDQIGMILAVLVLAGVASSRFRRLRA